VALACALSTFCGSASSASQLSFAIVIGSVVAFVVVKNAEPEALDEPYLRLWLLLPTTAVEMATLGTASYYARFPATFECSLAKVARWLCLDCLVWAALAWYLGEVLPGEFGVPKKPWFPLLWLRGLVARPAPAAADDYRLLEEAPEADDAVAFAGLRKTFGPLRAVDGASLTLKRGELTALLGHNGAGKTTLLRMLTGLSPPDAGCGGTASAYGRDLLARAPEGPRALLGVVPQHDVLWDHLTVREHAHLCAVLKSSSWASCRGADALLETFHLAQRLAHFGHELSGGMKRKLSTACALAGGSAFVVLDEPTTGLDPLARKELWDVLERQKRGRTLLLTTHYMDEADVLGDVVAIMAAGRLRCADAPEALKRAHGAGYKLVVETVDAVAALDLDEHPQTPPEAAIQLSETGPRAPAASHLERVAAVVRREAPGARAWERRFGDGGDLAEQRVISRTTQRLEFALPRDRPAAPVLRALEALDPPVRIGVADTDMEDVFLRVGDEAERERAELRRQASAGRRSSGDADPGGASDAAALGRQTLAMVRKRLRVAYHAPLRTFLLVLLPAGAAVAAFACNATDEFGQRGSFAANMTTCVVVMLGFVPLVGLVAEHVAAERATKLRNVLTVAGCDARAYWLGTLLGDLTLLLAVALCVSTVATVTGVYGGSYVPDDDQPAPHYQLSEHVSQAVAQTPDYVLEFAAENGAGARVPPAARHAFVDDAWLPRDLDDDRWLDSDLDFLHYAVDKAVDAAGDPTVDQAQRALLDDAEAVDDDVSLNEAAQALYSLASGAAPENAPEDGLRKWVAPETWLYPPLFLAQTACFAYLASFASSGPRTAVVLGPLMVLGLLFVPATLLSLVNLTLGDQGLGVLKLSNSAFLGVLFWGAALCTPHGGLVLEFARVSTQLAKYAEGYPPRAGTWLIAAIETLVFLYVAYRLDDRAAALRVSRVDHVLEDEDELDDDVRAERAKAARDGAPAAHALVLDRIRKVYGGGSKQETVAVENLSLTVDLGEIFGLLGANGAGKTSAIAVVMRAAFPSAGDAWVRGRSVLDDFAGAASHLGVVTQTDTLYDTLTCAEHLDLFLDLRRARGGRRVRGAERRRIVRQFLEDVELSHVPGRLASRLSGGMKRKLCVACALVGDPTVVLLDEPSAGLDPVSRRRLWAVLRKAMVGRAVVLTTHSMEEAEALCTRTAIMARGQLRALGTPLHLKAKFGAAWRLSLRGDGDGGEAKARAAALVPGARALPDRKKRVWDLEVPEASGRVGEVFAALEADVAGGLLGKLGVADFSLEQPRLEDAFLAVVEAADARAEANEAAVAEEDAAVLAVDGVPVVAAAAEGGDEPSDALSRCCCGLDRRAHKLLAVSMSLFALVLFFSMSGIVGTPSYDDDYKEFDDYPHNVTGCHHLKGAQSPCSVEAVYLNAFPFSVAFVMAVTGCCGACCCISKKADEALATGSAE